MTNRQEMYWKWAGRILVLLAGLGGILAAAQQLPAWFQNYAALAVALIAFAARWVEQQLPATKRYGPPSGVIWLALGALLLSSSIGCKTPTLASLYRSHGLLTISRDGADELLAKVQRARARACEAKHLAGSPDRRVLLLACLKDVRAPMATVWIPKVRPAINVALAGLWALLEAAHAAGDKSIDKASKAAAIACSSLTAVEVALKQYADKLGDAAGLLLGAAAGGKVFVCK